MARIEPEANGGYDYLFKIVLIGDEKVGKSSFLNMFANNHFDRNYVATIGVDFKIKMVSREGKQIKLQIWDTAGQERFQTIVDSYFRGAMGFIYMFDLSNEKSFHNLDSRWRSKVVSHTMGSVPSILVGNKVDVLATSERVVSVPAAREFANMIGGSYHEVSCTNRPTVDTAMMALVDQICKTAAPLSRPATHHSRVSKSPDFIEIDADEDEKKACCSIV